MTAQLIVIDLVQERATVVCAGHPAVLIQHEHTITPIVGDGSVLGISETVSFAPTIVPFAARDRLFVCTDGVSDLPRIDGRTGQRERFGLDGLARSLAPDLSLDAAVTGAWNAINTFCRRKPVDDMVLVGLEAQPQTSEYEPTEKKPGDIVSTIRTSAH